MVATSFRQGNRRIIITIFFSYSTGCTIMYSRAIVESGTTISEGVIVAVNRLRTTHARNRTGKIYFFFFLGFFFAGPPLLVPGAGPSTSICAAGVPARGVPLALPTTAATA